MKNKQCLSDFRAHGAGHVRYVYLALKRVIAIALAAEM